ncbi:hypothetical protein OESDEN_21764, partial [Oesophagostomum dentatum]
MGRMLFVRGEHKKEENNGFVWNAVGNCDSQLRLSKQLRLSNDGELKPENLAVHRSNPTNPQAATILSSIAD